MFIKFSSQSKHKILLIETFDLLSCSYDNDDNDTDYENDS